MTTTCLLLSLIALSLCYHAVKSKSFSKVEVEAYKKSFALGFFDDPPTVPDMIKKSGYPCESHTVVTEDGYILTLHRIPNGRKKNNWGNKRKTPVLLQHGLLSSSASWVLSSADKSLAYIYADAGYDVWLGNIRGNRYSRSHVTLDPSEKEFWNFSWDEMAYYDLPAQLDYVLNATNYSQLYYIGHSMGTTIFFAGMSMRPEYNAKIKTAYTLAPVGTVGHIETSIKYMAYLRNEILFTMEILRSYEFLPEDAFFVEVIRPICDFLQITEYLCQNMLFLVTGFDNHELNETMFPLITKELLSGTSIYTVIQFAQGYASGNFQHYDHGIIGNLDKYNQTTPPLYDLSKVMAPVVLFYGQNDYLADPEDVKFLAKNLPNVHKYWKVDYKDFNHLDFLWAIDAYRLVYKKLLEDMGHF